MKVIKLKYIKLIGLFSLVISGILIIILSLLNGPIVKQITLGISDKILHTLAYTWLGFSLYICFIRIKDIIEEKNVENQVFSKTTLALILSISIGFIFGLVIEIIQNFVGRTMDPLDLVANLIGLIVGSAIAQILVKFITPLLKNEIS